MFLFIIINQKYLEFYLSKKQSYLAAICKLQLKGEYPAVSQTCFIASNSSPLNSQNFPWIAIFCAIAPAAMTPHPQAVRVYESDL